MHSCVDVQDTKTVVGKLELVIGVVLHIIFIFFYLMVFNVSFLHECMYTATHANCVRTQPYLLTPAHACTHVTPHAIPTVFLLC